MAYHVEVENNAARALIRIAQGNRAAARRINTAIKNLATDPRPSGVVKLSGSTDAYRIRIGDYRVIYEIEDQILVITVVKIGHRRDVYER